MAEELAYIQDWTTQRASKLRTWIPHVTSYGVKNDEFSTIAEILRKLIPFIVVTSVFVFCLVLLLVAILGVRSVSSVSENETETPCFQCF